MATKLTRGGQHLDAAGRRRGVGKRRSARQLDDGTLNVRIFPCEQFGARPEITDDPSGNRALLVSMCKEEMRV
jgi:hypothetical protein